MTRLFFSMLLIALVHVLAAPNALADQTNFDRPKIGLALSGGGARGAAHVGVIKVLEEMRIPIDYIAGTSMGAVIGGLYASGMSSDEIGRQLKQINWNDVFKDKRSRPDRSQRRKDDDRLYLVKAKVGVDNSNVNLPSALILGQKFDLILKALTLPVADVHDFDRLPIPFRAVAMDITTGEEVVIARGDLALAMHASMAIPAAFSPIEWDGRLLVDGGAANNLPISVVRNMGANIVIAVDISTPLLKKAELSTLLDTLDQLTGILTRRNVDAQIKTLTDKDILIVPELGSISTMDFERADEAVNVGMNKGRESEQQLAKLGVGEKTYLDYVARQQRSERAIPVISFIRFENDSALSDEVLRQHFALETGQPLDIGGIESGIAAIYGLDIFESVRYDVVTEQEQGKAQTGVVVKVTEKSWGTNSLQGGIELSSDLSGQSSFNIGIAFTKMPLNKLNGEWRTAIQLGEEPGVFTEIYQPLDPAARYFSTAAVSFDDQNVRLFSGIGNRADVEYDIQRYGLRLALGRNFGKWGDLRFGLNRLFGEADVSVGPPSFNNFDFDDGYFFVRARTDTLDSLNFPKSGYLNEFQWLTASESLGADTDYDQIELRLSGAKSWGDDTVLAGFRFGSTVRGDAPIYNRFRLGGFMQLSGLEQNEISGQHAGMATVAYQRRIYRSELVPVYGGVVLQAGNTWESQSDISTGDLLGSGTLYLGTDTPLGPLYLGFGVTEGGNNAAYLFLGQPFFKVSE